MRKVKTVQEYLIEIDSEKLINEYLYTHPINLHEVSDDTMTIKKMKELVRKKLQHYIERLQTIKIAPSEEGKEYVLFAHKVLEDGFDEEKYSLVCLQEVMENDTKVESYAYELTRQAEIMGFKISDAEYTQKHIYGLLADVLHEASFFGFEQQHLDEEKRKLEEAIKECEEGNAVSYSMDEFREKWGLEKEEKDEVADKLRQQALESLMKYNRYCKQKELRELKL